MCLLLPEVRFGITALRSPLRESITVKLEYILFPGTIFPPKASHMQRNKTKMSLYVTHNETRVSILLILRPAVLKCAVTAHIESSDGGIPNQAHII